MSASGSVPPDKMQSFWQKLAYLTSRSRHGSESGYYAGTPEVKEWNRRNMESCEKCMHTRSLKTCVIEEDQASCRCCREAKIACDRTLKFLFESTREEYFNTFQEFMDAYNSRNAQQWRSYKRLANKQRKATMPYASVRTSQVNSTKPPACLHISVPIDVLEEILAHLERLSPGSSHKYRIELFNF